MTRARREAKRTAIDIGEYYYYDTSWALDWSWWLEPNEYAYRQNRSRIVYDAQFTLDDLDGYEMTCDIKIVAWRYRDGPELSLVTTAYMQEELDPEFDCFDSSD